jgi:hypothetical protein
MPERVVDCVRARTATGLALLLVLGGIGTVACSETQPSPTPSSPIIGDLAGVEIEVHKAPG